MSIPVLPNNLYPTGKHVSPCQWYILFTDETYSKSPADFSAFSSLVQYGNKHVWQSEKLAYFLSVTNTYDSGHPVVLEAPTEIGTHFFAFKESRMPLSHVVDPEWLYTCFGYVYGRTRLNVYVTPHGVVSQVTAKDAPFWS